RVEAVEGFERCFDRCDENLARRAAVDVHLLVLLAVDGHWDLDRWQGAGNRGRGEDHLAEQVERVRMRACSDLAHVPDNGPLCVEIGGEHEQKTALPVLRRDL